MMDHQPSVCLLNLNFFARPLSHQPEARIRPFGTKKCVGGPFAIFILLAPTNSSIAKSFGV